MKRFASYLNAHNTVRTAVLWLDIALASVTACVGVGVYALTTGAKAIGNYMSDRIMAVCLLATALVLDLAFAWLLGLQRPSMRFVQRLFVSAVATVFGAIVVFGLIVSRAILWHHG